ncbi:MAG: hypothetical protein R3E95_05530 [Thiolinea sp.]
MQAAQAGLIEAELQQAMQTGHEVRFIVQFTAQVDLNAFPGQGKGKGQSLASLLWALRHQAMPSQAEAIQLLKQHGARQLLQLWSINALVATARSGDTSSCRATGG